MTDRPEYAKTKAGLIAQVNDLHQQVIRLTADRDEWDNAAREALEILRETAEQRDEAVRIAEALQKVCQDYERLLASMNAENN